MKYPVLYAQSLSNTMYKHCQKGYVVYFKKPINDHFLNKHELNQDYLLEVYNGLYQIVHDKFIASTPLFVMNNRQRFIMFKSNLEPVAVKEFLMMALDELAYHTHEEFTMDIIITEAMIMEMNLKPGLLSANKVGDKLAECLDNASIYETIKSHGWKNDNGFFPDYMAYLKQHGELNESIEEIDDDELLSNL